MKLRELCLRADMAIRLGSPDYAIAICRYLLRSFPGLVQARCLHGQAQLEKGALDQAASEFRVALELDPENVLAHSGLGVIALRQGDLERAIERFERALELRPNDTVVKDSLLQLYSQRDGQSSQPRPTVPHLALAGWRMRRHEYDLALRECDWLLANRPERAEVLLLRAEILWRDGRQAEAERACQEILKRWPRCLKARLMLGELMALDVERERQGVAMLHEAFGTAPDGILAKALFRDRLFELPSLFADLELPDSNGETIPTPPELETALAMLPRLDPMDNTETDWVPPPGLNTDPPPLSAPPPPAKYSEEASAAAAEAISQLERLAEELAHPSYARPRTLATQQSLQLILTSRRRLIQRYGLAGLERLESKLQDYSEALIATGSDGRLIYLDDPACLALYGLDPVSADEPGEIKALIGKLEKSLFPRADQPASVLILGGDAIVPFFRLENPAEDDDDEVLSDNPYASSDDDYLLPDRSLGRLPDSESADLTFLLRQLDTAILRRHDTLPRQGPLGCLGALRRLPLATVSRWLQQRQMSFGYSTCAWRQTSEVVFATIGDQASLKLSPPTTQRDLERRWPSQSRLSYFNLGGARDTPHWYGHKDKTYPPDYPTMPIALSANLLGHVNVAGSVVFSEACYGGHILQRTPTSSIAMRFLAEGALALVGSTAISYGSALSYPSAADLLALHFWQSLMQGLSLGEALREAKQSFFQDALHRQGWLDGDDQKTLLQFVLYGDPSIRLQTGKSPPTRTVNERAAHATISPAAVCKRFRSTRAGHSLSPDTVRKVVEHLQLCVPDAGASTIRIARQGVCHGHCSDCPYGVPQSLRSTVPSASLWTFTSQRSVPAADGAQLRQYARVTLDGEAKIVKTVVSR